MQLPDYQGEAPKTKAGASPEAMGSNLGIALAMSHQQPADGRTHSDRKGSVLKIADRGVRVEADKVIEGREQVLG